MCGTTCASSLPTHQRLGAFKQGDRLSWRLSTLDLCRATSDHLLPVCAFATTMRNEATSTVNATQLRCLEALILFCCIPTIRSSVLFYQGFVIHLTTFYLRLSKPVKAGRCQLLHSTRFSFWVLPWIPMCRHIHREPSASRLGALGHRPPIRSCLAPRHGEPHSAVR